jgi:ubiquinone/menaquinone biosynthesis C-methylase UbiE
MSACVCPWWLGYLLINPLRLLLQNPEKILSPFVAPGMTVLDLGPGMGFFTLPLAKLVGPNGLVLAVDLEPRMLEALKRRADKAGLADRIETRTAVGNDLGCDDFENRVDFALAFAVVHEMPNFADTAARLGRLVKTGGRLLICEPIGHVSQSDLDRSVEAARQAGFHPVANPVIRFSRNVLLEKR